MKLFPPALALIISAGMGVTGRCASQPPPLEDFFKDPSFDQIVISPTGKRVAALSKWKEHLNLYVIDLKTKRPTQLTGLDTIDITGVHWVGDDRLVFSTRDDGFLTGGLYSIDADGSHSRVLGESIQQQENEGKTIIRETSFLDRYCNSTDEILVLSNERRLFDSDVYRMNVHTGAKQMVARNPGHIEHWVADGTGAVRAGFGAEGRDLFLIYRDTADGEWREIKRWDFMKGGIEPLAFDQANKLLYVLSSLDRNTDALCLYDPAAGKIERELYADNTYDMETVILSRSDRSLLGYRFHGERPEWVWTDPAMKKLQALVDQELPGTKNLFFSRSEDNAWVVIDACSDRDPGTFYLLNTRGLTMEKLVSRMGWIKFAQMAEMKPIQYQARDGMTIHGYLTLPVGMDPHSLPLIVNPHGGPWVRDEWGFDPEVQFFASRGYAVLQTNFRGSTGYGGKFLTAGYGQWGLAMQDDITDGVRWVISQGIVDPKRIAIYGASYGGYAAMAGLAFTPELYRCGINYVGVTDIELLLKTIPKAWESTRAQMEAMTGNAKRDRERLRATSVLLNADKIRVPVFFAYGELDDRVDMKHATKLASKLKANHIPVEWMVRSDEGHGYHHWDNKIGFYRAAKKFLARNLALGPVGEVVIGKPEVIEMPASDKR